MANLDFWNKVKEPASIDKDVKPTKNYKGKGGFQGTAIQPFVLLEMATAEWGPMGLSYSTSANVDAALYSGSGSIPVAGWGFVVVSEGCYPENDPKEHRVHLRLWYPAPDGSMRCVEEWGCTPLKEKVYDKMEDVADIVKKSMTDAKNRCLSQLGFAATIFQGAWDETRAAKRAEEKRKETAENDPLVEKILAALGNTELTRATYDALKTQYSGLSQDKKDLLTPHFKAVWASKGWTK